MGLLLVAFTAPPAAHADELLVHDKVNQSSYVPIYGSYHDTQGAHCQTIMPATELEDMAGKKITKITFYAQNIYFSGGEIELSLGETDDTQFQYYSTPDYAVTPVATITPSAGTTTLSFDLDYDYSGKNLVIQLKTTTAGSWGNNPTQFYGETQSTNTAKYVNSSSTGNGNTVKFLPKTLFEYSGEAKPYDAKVTPTELAFGKKTPGEEATLNITVQNKGTNAITPSVSGISAPFSTTYTSASLASGETATIPVKFNPTTVGDWNETATISFGTTELDDVNITLTGSASYELTVADGTATSSYLPVYGLYYDEYAQTNQMIYPAEMLSSLNGKRIKSLTFYSSSTEFFTEGSVTFSLGNVNAGTTFNSAARITPNDLTPVYSSTPTVAQEWTISFDENANFVYNGGDLLVDVVTTTGKYKSVTFLGELGHANASWYTSSSSGSGTLQNFLPKVTFTFEDAAGAVTVTPTSLTFGGEEFYTGQTEEKTFTVNNTTEEAATITMTGDNMFTFSPATAPAGETTTVTVTYAPTEAGSHTATLTVGGKTVTLTGTATVPPTPIISATPTTLEFTTPAGIAMTNTFTVTGENLTGNITVAATGEGFSVSPTTIAAADAAEGVEVTVTYAPTTAGETTGTITLSSEGAENVTVALTGNCLEIDAYAVTVNPETGHDFGTVGTDQTVTWTIKVKNEGANAVTPTLSALAAPYSTNYTPAALAYGEEANIVISFAPTAIQTYPDVPVTLSFPGSTIVDYNFTLKGEGVEPTGTLPASFYDGIEYTWTDSENVEHTSTLGEIATDPDQMIALMREVYTNKALPGPFYRGYDANGNVETAYPVAYPAIGTVTRFGAYGVANNYTYNDAGWGITHDEAAYPFDVLYESSSSNNVYKALNGSEYKPNEEGLTLLLVEMKDGVTHATVGNSVTSASGLRNVFDKMFKSVRVITHSKRFGQGAEAGTLFKIDCDKMNRFFFLGKGRLRLYNDAYYDTSHRLGRSNFFIDKKNQTSSSQSTSNVVSDEGPFFEMFEQFSPVSLSEGTIADDIYQSLINMESYGVEHDCQYIPWATTDASSSGSAVIGHEFNMYGKTSLSADCQDVRDLMFFIPDQRMKYWSDGTGFSDPRRDKGENDKFVNYYKEMAPTMALYVIRQNPITGEQKTYNGNENNYELHLTWESNLTSILPAAEGSYFIYQVNDDGSYTQVGTTDANTTELYVNVAMQQHGQQVTYVIQGQDKSKFLSLQMSNEESFIIPGLDPYEKFQLNPNADYYSRFDPAQETNFYANGMQIKAYPDVNASDFAGQTINFYRKAAGETEWTKVASATVNSGATEATVSMVDATQRAQSEYKYGYKSNDGSVTITTDNHGYKVFDNIYDNFKALVTGNNHPNYYTYKVAIGEADAAEAVHSNEITIRVFKTNMSTIAGEFTEDDVKNDDDHTVDLEKTAFDIDVEYSSKTEILRYDAYRWAEGDNYYIIDHNSPADNEQDIAPNGIAGNQGTSYTTAMNDDFTGSVAVTQGQTAKAPFEDSYPEKNVGSYVYAPVVETFAPTGWGRDDYNTYGAPLQNTATGKVELSDLQIVGSKSYTFTPDGKTGDYVYYNSTMKATVTIPSGYNIYMIRAWRLIDEDLLGEIDEAYVDREDGDYMFEKITDASPNQPIPLGSTDISIPGSHDQNVLSGTFGAKKLEGNDTFNAKFIVRAYFSKNETSTTMYGKAGETYPYYIAEATQEKTVTSSVITGVVNVQGAKEVAGVKYYNLAGMESNEPFSGVNIVVTRYTDGSVTSSKVMR